MLQLYPAYSLCNRCKTLTGSLDSMYMQPTNRPCTSKLQWGASQVTLWCLPSYTDVLSKLHTCDSQVTLGASQVTLWCLPSYTDVLSKLHTCDSQVTLGASQVTLWCLTSYTDVLSKLYTCDSQVTLGALQVIMMYLWMLNWASLAFQVTMVPPKLHWFCLTPPSPCHLPLPIGFPNFLS